MAGTGTGWTGTRIVPGDWKRRRREVLHRAEGHCEACGAEARLAVDHIVNVAESGTHELDNLQALCPPCHELKTRQEQSRGRERRTARLRATAPHPGLIR